MTTPRKINMLERLANMAGHIYRHQARQFPRRFALLKEVAKKEIAPPMPKEWPTVVSEFRHLVNVINTKAYRQYTVREAMVYSAVFMEVIFWFFVGEMIGRRYICGYLVPASYVSKNTRKLAAQMEAEDKHNF
ncbi:putative ATP synthase subunit g 2, mitochondrial [Toxocara canis]|uniref:Putative ATP synthase subunit g 2, mitochondrial n=1 Tax=Toxocara canis TaxID=6265 RepID=A0A0B2V9U6_TOXCA|nr:putative ATP synthase subunit g 2, mitochondrial [Toxocara canis]